MSKTYSAIITEEGGVYVALNPDTQVASQGDTLNQALDNLKEALELYFEETSDSDIEDTSSRPTMLTTVTI